MSVGEGGMEALDLLRRVAAEAYGDGDKEPKWKLLQIAVWAIVDNIDYSESTIKPPTNSCTAPNDPVM